MEEPHWIPLELLALRRGKRPLADVARHLGITYSRAWHLENGKRIKIDYRLVPKIIEIYELTIDDIEPAHRPRMRPFFARFQESAA